MAITFEQWTKQIEQVEKEMPDQMENLLETVGLAMAAETFDRWENEIAPDETKWKPLSMFTLSQRRKKGVKAKILVDTGFMISSVDSKNETAIPKDMKIDVTNMEINMKVGADYAWKHQFGEGRIPARPMLDLDEENTNETLAMEEAMEDSLEYLLKKI